MFGGWEQLTKKKTRKKTSRRVEGGRGANTIANCLETYECEEMGERKGDVREGNVVSDESRRSKT